ncbi:hypothetical protein QJQ45_018731, partial [Haematococcus lacustris]
SQPDSKVMLHLSTLQDAEVQLGRLQFALQHIMQPSRLYPRPGYSLPLAGSFPCSGHQHSSSGRHLLSPMRCMFSAALQSMSSHLPGCGAGLALAALPWALLGSAAGSALVRLLRLADRGVLGPGSEAAGCEASWLLHGACGGLRGTLQGHYIMPRTGWSRCWLQAGRTMRWCTCPAGGFESAGLVALRLLSRLSQGCWPFTAELTRLVRCSSTSTTLPLSWSVPLGLHTTLQQARSTAPAPQPPLVPMPASPKYTTSCLARPWRSMDTSAMSSSNCSHAHKANRGGPDNRGHQGISQAGFDGIRHYYHKHSKPSPSCKDQWSYWEDESLTAAASPFIDPLGELSSKNMGGKPVPQACPPVPLPSPPPLPPPSPIPVPPPRRKTRYLSTTAMRQLFLCPCELGQQPGLACSLCTCPHCKLHKLQLQPDADGSVMLTVRQYGKPSSAVGSRAAATAGKATVELLCMRMRISDADDMLNKQLPDYIKHHQLAHHQLQLFSVEIMSEHWHAPQIGILVAHAYFKSKEGAYKEHTVHVMTNEKEQSAAITQAAVNQVVCYLQAEHDMDMRQVHRAGQGLMAEICASCIVGVVKQHLKAPSRRAEPFACLADCRSPWVPAARARRRKRDAEIRPDQALAMQLHPYAEAHLVQRWQQGLVQPGYLFRRAKLQLFDILLLRAKCQVALGLKEGCVERLQQAAEAIYLAVAALHSTMVSCATCTTAWDTPAAAAAAADGAKRQEEHHQSQRLWQQQQHRAGLLLGICSSSSSSGCSWQRELYMAGLAGLGSPACMFCTQAMPREVMEQLQELGQQVAAAAVRVLQNMQPANMTALLARHDVHLKHATPHMLALNVAQQLALPVRFSVIRRQLELATRTWWQCLQGSKCTPSALEKPRAPQPAHAAKPNVFGTRSAALADFGREPAMWALPGLGPTSRLCLVWELRAAHIATVHASAGPSTPLGKQRKERRAEWTTQRRQRIGESKWRPLELCWWSEQGKLPAKGKEYPGLGYKRVRDKPPKAQPVEAQ